MNNSVFDNTMENIRKRVHVCPVTDQKKLLNIKSGIKTDLRIIKNV